MKELYEYIQSLPFDLDVYTSFKRTDMVWEGNKWNVFRKFRYTCEIVYVSPIYAGSHILVRAQQEISCDQKYYNMIAERVNKQVKELLEEIITNNMYEGKPLKEALISGEFRGWKQ